MFNQDFYPTDLATIELMTEGLNLTGKTVYEPQAGKGNIVDYCLNQGADVICSEINKDLQKILQTKCKVIAEDCLTVTSEMISHVDFIIMNPPFSEGVRHILHLYEIAPAGCKIISLINSSNLKNTYTKDRQTLSNIIEIYGRSIDLGDAFSEAERKTGVNVSMIVIDKPGESYQKEFEGFFMEDDPHEEQINGLMEYNVIRDLVNRYVAAVKLYDEQLAVGIKMNSLLSSFYGESLAFSCTEKGVPKLRNDFKKDMQKAGWKFIFDKMNMQKYVTSGVRNDINRFVEQQTQLPFTMRNIYKMLEIIVATRSQTMDRAILEAFDKVTRHHEDNRLGLEGWKTNSHYLLTETFILPWMVDFDTRWPKDHVSIRIGGNSDVIEDLVKALCFISGRDYNTMTPLSWFFDRGLNAQFGQWYSWGFFEVKGFKKGTMHFKFQDKALWEKFNKTVAKLKGYPLFEGKEQTEFQKKQTGRAYQEAINQTLF